MASLDELLRTPANSWSQQCTFREPRSPSVSSTQHDNLISSLKPTRVHGEPTEPTRQRKLVSGLSPTDSAFAAFARWDRPLPVPDPSWTPLTCWLRFLRTHRQPESPYRTLHCTPRRRCGRRPGGGPSPSRTLESVSASPQRDELSFGTTPLVICQPEPGTSRHLGEQASHMLSTSTRQRAHHRSRKAKEAVDMTRALHHASVKPGVHLEWARTSGRSPQRSDACTHGRTPCTCGEQRKTLKMTNPGSRIRTH
ncbi:hypothetical protein QBC39DRAFT_141820 [Podospora conica]|nr:hypothetical protein QBC39DRAFT_141820 [Schizothecium conicum]